MKIEMLESGESPDFGPFKVGDVFEVKDKTGETLIYRGLAKPAGLVIDLSIKKKGGKDNG